MFFHSTRIFIDISRKSGEVLFDFYIPNHQEPRSEALFTQYFIINFLIPGNHLVNSKIFVVQFC